MEDDMIYEAWLSGDVTTREAIIGLLAHMDRIEVRARHIDSQRTRVREQLKQCTAREGGNVKIEGWGELSITPAHERRYTDPKAVSDLAAKLDESHPEIAEQLRQCVKISTIAEVFRANRVKREEPINEPPF